MLQNNLEMVKDLLDRKSNANHLNEDKQSAGLWACGGANLEIVKLLADRFPHNQKPRPVDNKGEGYLFWAARREEDSYDVCLELLSRSWIEVLQKNNKGETAADVATDGRTR